MQQGPALQRALASTNDGNALSEEPSGITALIAVRKLQRGQGGKLRRDPQKWANTCSDNHLPRVQYFSVLKFHAKTALVPIDGYDFSLIQAGKQLPLKPASVFNKRLERNRSARRNCCR